MADSETTDDVVRQLARLDYSTRKIAAQTGLSQTTVVRTLARINSGPQPVYDPASADTRPQPAYADAPAGAHPVLRPPPPALAPGPAPELLELRAGRKPQGAVVFALALLCLLLAALALWLSWRVTAPGAPGPVAACVKYSPKGYVTAITAMPAMGCPGSESMVVLLPAASG